MSKKIIPLLFAAVMLAGAWSSCKKHITEPPQDTVKCDTCTKDTTHHPCDTCNINKDSAAHAFNWQQYTIPSETNLTGVWVFGPNDIYVLGSTLYHFNGTTFTDLQPRQYISSGSISLDGSLSGYNIFAFSKTDFWMVAGSDALYTTDGTNFVDYRPGPLVACWGLSNNDMFFVGSSGHISHFDGTKFTSMTSNTTKDLGQIWGTNDNNIWASGWNPNTGVSVLMHYDGLAWAEQDLNKLKTGQNALIGVWTCDSSLHHITIACGSFVYRTTDNWLWYSDTLKNSLGGGAYAALTQIRGNGATDFMVQGSGGFLSHWNGKTWYFYQQFFDWNNPDYDIGAFSFNGNTACMVGYKNGQGWLTVGTRKQ